MALDRAYTAQLESAFSFAQHQVRSLIEKHPDYYPMYTKNGKWKHEGEKWTHWCDGFLPGQMWIFHERTRDPFWAEKAIRYSLPLEPRQYDRDVHDLGFIFFSTYWRWLEARKVGPASLPAGTEGGPTNEHIENVLIQAGTTMSLRFKEKGQYLRSFVEDASLFVDIMMNVGIIFYAAHKQKERGKLKEAAELFRIASAHCRTSLRTLVRGDGSTAHEALFNLETGECLRQTTHQGYRGDSCWSRGLAWALYGFGSAYHYTGESAYLDAAEACARFYIQNTPEHGVPPWDYDAPSSFAKPPEITAEDMLQGLASRFVMEAVDLAKIEISLAVINLVPADLCHENCVIPIKFDNGVLTIAIPDPLDLQALDNVRFVLNHEVVPVLASEAQIKEAIGKYYGAKKETFNDLLDPPGNIGSALSTFLGRREGDLEDSSAAAIAASGLFNLSKFSASFEKRTLYRQYFRRIMRTLTTDEYLGRNMGWEGILKHGVYHIHKKLGVDESVMWGDYFFVEALGKALSEGG